MKKIITIIAVLLFISCSSNEEEYNLFTGSYKMSANQNDVCGNKIFLEFNTNTFNTIWYDASNCNNNSTNTVSRGYSIFNDNTIRINSVTEKGFLRITENGLNSFIVCFSENSSTDDNIIYSECYNIER